MGGAKGPGGGGSGNLFIFSNGYYLSTDAVITHSDKYLAVSYTHLTLPTILLV